MKKILIALAIMPLFFVACSSSDDVPSSGDFDYSIDLLYGEWRATEVESVGSQDLTSPINELYAAPTYLKFNKDGTLEGEGLFGEGMGRFSTKEKTIYTSIGKNKKNFEVVSLQSSKAKVKVDAKGLGTPLIPDNTGIVTFTLEKNYSTTPDFDYNINALYGRWYAVRLEGEGLGTVDLTHQLVTPTYLTFEAKGALIAEGYLGNETGRYTTEEKTIHTLINKKRLDFEVTTLTATTARVKFKSAGLDFGGLIPVNVETVTLELKKQQ